MTSKQSEVEKSFTKNIGLSIGAFLALLVVQTFALELYDLAPWAKVAVTLVPVVPILFSLLSAVKNFRQMDEFMQRVHGESLLWSIGILCAASFVYGMLEMVLGIVPVISVIWLLPAVALLSGAVNFILMRRYDGK